MSNIIYDSAKISNLNVSMLDYNGVETSFNESKSGVFTRTIRIAIHDETPIWRLYVHRNAAYNIQLQIVARAPDGRGMTGLYAYEVTDTNGVRDFSGVVVYKTGAAADDIKFLIDDEGEPGFVNIRSPSSTPSGTVVSAKIDIVSVRSTPLYE